MKKVLSIGGGIFLAFAIGFGPIVALGVDRYGVKGALIDGPISVAQYTTERTTKMTVNFYTNIKKEFTEDERDS